MGLFSFNKKPATTTEVVSTEPGFHSFSTPFGKIGAGNLALPFIRAYNSESYIRFGEDNLYPQLLNQMYYQSHLNGSIVNYKTKAVIGGGFTLECPDESALQTVKEYKFMKVNKFAKLVRQSTKDFIVHGRICVIVDPTGTDVKIKRVGPEEVRSNEKKTQYFISSDWSIRTQQETLPAYHPELKCRSMYVYEMDADCGQTIYPLPSYVSCMNDAFLEGQISYFQKSNIINSVYPSFMVSVVNAKADQKLIDGYTETIKKQKGVSAAGNIWSFFARSKEELPTITPMPTTNNDKIFDSTIINVGNNICHAHQIDPLLMGIRVSGSLGNGNELMQQYTIFQNNVVLPLRAEIKEFADELLMICNMNSTVNIANFQIIEGEIFNVAPQLNQTK